MGRYVEKSGKNVNDAIAAALEELNLTIDDVHVDVLNEGKIGLFGLLSGKPARVRVSELDEDERMPQPGYSSTATVSDGDRFGEDAGQRDQKGTGDDLTARADIGDDSVANAGSGSGAGMGKGVGSSASEYINMDMDSDEDMDSSMDDSAPGLNYENDVNRAMEFLFEIFNGIHVSVNMKAEPADEGFLINIESEDSGILIGRRGETLDAIQYLVNLYMNKEKNAFIRVSIDVENYKKKREAALIRLAGQMADKVVRLRRNFTMDAMNSYERRIVHSVLQNHPRVETYSIGEEPNRKIVVTLKNRGGYSSR